MPSNTATLAAAIRARHASVAGLRAQHVELIDELSADPEDEALPGRLAAVESELARANASIGALELALDAAKTRQAAERRAAAIAATEEQRQQVLAAAAARGKLAARCDAAADAFVAALKALYESGIPIAANATDVLFARHPDLPARLNEAPMILPSASGSFHGAMAHVLRRAQRVSGPCPDLWQLNSFADTTDAHTFVNANVKALHQLEQRL